jgi:glycosyltransferase involved in cell wall biosynthesis
MNRPFVSVLVTTYNYGRFIEECIDSVLSQSYPLDLMEIVVVDDGSTDDTAERVKKYGSKIRYFHKPNGGQASALNLAFARARGEIVSLLDGDDFFLPGKVARVAEVFERDPSLGMFYHPFLEFDMATNERRVSKFPLFSGSVFENPGKFLGYAGQGTCVSFRRKFVDRLLPIPEEIRMLADGYLGSLIVFVAPILSLPECLSGYRFHGKNAYHVDETSTEVRRDRLRLYRIEFAAMRRWLASNGFNRKQLAVRQFLDWWNVHFDWEEFPVKPPSRMRFFWWTVRKNHTYSVIQTWKFTLFNYLTAFFALLFGYSKANEIWRQGTMEATRRVHRALFDRHSSHSPTTYWPP